MAYPCYNGYAFFVLTKSLDSVRIDLTNTVKNVETEERQVTKKRMLDRQTSANTFCEYKAMSLRVMRSATRSLRGFDEHVLPFSTLVFFQKCLLACRGQINYALQFRARAQLPIRPVSHINGTSFAPLRVVSTLF